MSDWKNFDPDQAATEASGIFNLTCSEEEAQVIVVPVPWEATTSYGNGASKGPKAVYEASKQQDLCQLGGLEGLWRQGIYMRPIDSGVETLNAVTKPLAQKVIKGEGLAEDLEAVNEASAFVNAFVAEQTASIYKAGKLPVILGGDHSVPYGAFVATGEHHGNFGILHIDAHADLREAFMGFKYSHASIMNNALSVRNLIKLVQVGIRDFGYAEVELSQNDPRIATYFDEDVKRDLLLGRSWRAVVDQVVYNLPKKVWLSFDIDGLDPSLCPNTGTPVPGGLSFEQAAYLIERVVASRRVIVGCDLNEVAPGEDEWDANVGMRMLYKMINNMLASQEWA